LPDSLRIVSRRGTFGILDDADAGVGGLSDIKKEGREATEDYVTLGPQITLFAPSKRTSMAVYRTMFEICVASAEGAHTGLIN